MGRKIYFLGSLEEAIELVKQIKAINPDFKGFTETYWEINYHIWIYGTFGLNPVQLQHSFSNQNLRAHASMANSKW